MITESILIYPNPASSALTLELNSKQSGSLEFHIIDASGRSIRQFNHEVVTGYQSLDLSNEIKGLLPATYMLVIGTENDKIVKNFTIKPH
jgi:hypothetical protein